MKSSILSQVLYEYCCYTGDSGEKGMKGEPGVGLPGPPGPPGKPYGKPYFGTGWFNENSDREVGDLKVEWYNYVHLLYMYMYVWNVDHHDE